MPCLAIGTNWRQKVVALARAIHLRQPHLTEVEYICILSLSVYGVERAPALGYGILLHVLILAPQALAGILTFAGIHVGREAVAIFPSPK